MDNTFQVSESLTPKEILARLSQGSSLVYKVLSAEGEEYLQKLLDRRTPYGRSFIHLISSGLHNPASEIGVYADGAATYQDTLFGDFFAKIIHLYHGFDASVQKHTENFDISDLSMDDLNMHSTDKCRVLSVRVRYAFALADQPFQSAMTREQRKQAESSICKVFDMLPAAIRGTYESLESMSSARREQLIKDHLLSPTEEDDFLINAGMISDWPVGRGIYLSHDKTFFVLVNDEDNRVGVLEQSGDLKRIFIKLASANDIFNSQLHIARNDLYGKLVSCPTNIGTGMRLSVMVTLPNLVRDMEALKKKARTLGLSVRGHYGEHSGVGLAGEVDISNKARLGISERDIVQLVYEGVRELMHMEKGYTL